MGKLNSKLKELRHNDVISDLEFNFIRFLNSQQENISDSLIITAVTVSYLYRNGHVCMDLAEFEEKDLFSYLTGNNNLPVSDIQTPSLDNWLQDLYESSLVGKPGDYKPILVEDDRRVYLHKLWKQERAIADNILKLAYGNDYSGQIPDLDQLDENFEVESGPNWQKIAVIMSLINNFTIITGGPGTGKTSTILRLLIFLLKQAEKSGQKLNIALAAPTGKASQRLRQSIQSNLLKLNIDNEIIDQIPDQPVTIHQLLGASYYRTGFKFNNNNPLPHDLIVIDEASMIDQLIMYHLLEAITDQTRLILVGDRNQLASVEAGSVFGDLCGIDSPSFSKDIHKRLKKAGIELPGKFIRDHTEPLDNHIVELTHNYRFSSESGIGRLSTLIREGETDKAVALLNDQNMKNLSFVEISDTGDFKTRIKDLIIPYFKKLLNLSSFQELLQLMMTHKFLCAHHKGPLGVRYTNKVIEDTLLTNGLISKRNAWYKGRPILIKKNDYLLRLQNGDLGIVWPDENGKLQVIFDGENNEYRSIHPARLPDHETAFAMTVHKSQGSEFENVELILPAKPSKILTRELIYTGVTRSRRFCAIWGSESVLEHGIRTIRQRSSGLREKLWQVPARKRRSESQTDLFT